MDEVNVMIDIEALALRPGAAITELAAVVFDISNGAISDEFHCHIKPAAPFVVDVETMLWHGQHGRPLEHPEAIPPITAISNFLDWLDQVAPERRSRVMWSWGVDFDFPLLEPYLDLRGDRPEPFRYHQRRCARTLWKLAFANAQSPERPHSALEDARLTVRDLVGAIRQFKIPATGPA